MVNLFLIKKMINSTKWTSISPIMIIKNNYPNMSLMTISTVSTATSIHFKMILMIISERGGILRLGMQ